LEPPPPPPVPCDGGLRGMCWMMEGGSLLLLDGVSLVLLLCLRGMAESRDGRR
jgi:hypothetical protein